MNLPNVENLRPPHVQEFRIVAEAETVIHAIENISPYQAISMLLQLYHASQSIPYRA